jgi:hypothetical protein
VPPEPADSLDRMSPAEVLVFAGGLLAEMVALRSAHQDLRRDFVQLKTEHQAVKDELARVKKLPPRPPIKPSGMEKGTSGKKPEVKSGQGEGAKRGRGPLFDRLKITATVVVAAKAPLGSRHKGYEEIVVQDLSLEATATLYRRERWRTPEGETIVAALDPAIVGGFGPNLHRAVLQLHFQSQVSCERIVALLNDLGVTISKRQVVRLLTTKLEAFRAEDAEVLKAGLMGDYVSVDDTGARHAGKNGYTTQIGSDRFCVFRTGPSKSRLAFLSWLRGRACLFVINQAALDYMKERALSDVTIAKFAEMQDRVFESKEAWEDCLKALGLHEIKGTLDPCMVATEGALWGAIRHQGLAERAVILSDDAGQFRVGQHALCWVHAERLVHKLVPANDKQRNAIENAKRMIWWFYRLLKAYKLAPSADRAELLTARFERIFNRARTGYVTLDKLLKRLHANGRELLRVLERPEIPLNTNASENDIRTVVTKRKISGGTVSDKGRDARDVMLGLYKTCKKLRISFYQFLGDRLGIPGSKVAPLQSLVRPLPS